MLQTLAKISTMIALSVTGALFVLIALGLPVTDELRIYGVAMYAAATMSVYLAYR